MKNKIIVVGYPKSGNTWITRLAGRLCGEQDYSQNLHKCIFDRQFLIFSLEWAGFGNIKVWDPQSMQFAIDASFDSLNGNRTSLNLMAEKT
jgi:hypothetical protein